MRARFRAGLACGVAAFASCRSACDGAPAPSGAPSAGASSSAAAATGPMAVTVEVVNAFATSGASAHQAVVRVAVENRESPAGVVTPASAFRLVLRDGTEVASSASTCAPQPLLAVGRRLECALTFEHPSAREAVAVRFTPSPNAAPLRIPLQLGEGDPRRCGREARSCVEVLGAPDESLTRCEEGRCAGVVPPKLAPLPADCSAVCGQAKLVCDDRLCFGRACGGARYAQNGARGRLPFWGAGECGDALAVLPPESRPYVGCACREPTTDAE